MKKGNATQENKKRIEIKLKFLGVFLLKTLDLLFLGYLALKGIEIISGKSVQGWLSSKKIVLIIVIGILILALWSYNIVKSQEKKEIVNKETAENQEMEEEKKEREEQVDVAQCCLENEKKSKLLYQGFDNLDIIFDDDDEFEMPGNTVMPTFEDIIFDDDDEFKIPKNTVMPIFDDERIYEKLDVTDRIDEKVETIGVENLIEDKSETIIWDKNIKINQYIMENKHFNYAYKSQETINKENELVYKGYDKQQLENHIIDYLKKEAGLLTDIDSKQIRFSVSKDYSVKDKFSKTFEWIGWHSILLTYFDLNPEIQYYIFAVECNKQENYTDHILVFQREKLLELVDEKEPIKKVHFRFGEKKICED